MTATHALTGDDLSLDDVWAVAVERRPAPSSPTRRATPCARHAPSSKPWRTARSEHTYGVNTGFGRFVSKSIPEEQTEELQLRLLRSHACGVGEPYPDSGRACGDAAARERAREGQLRRAHRDGRAAARVPEPRRSAVRARAWLGRRLRRPRAARASRAAARRRGAGVVGRASCSTAPTRSRAPASSRCACVAKEGLSLINGTQFMAAQGALALVRAWRLARVADCVCALSLEALQGSRNSFIPQVHALRPLRGQAASARNVLRLLDGSAISESHRWCDKVQDAYSLRCAPQVHGACRDLLDYVDYTVDDRVELGDRQPARPRRRRDARLGRELPRPAARVRARCARDGRRRAREHLRAPRRAARQPEPERRPAGVPDDRRRAELRVHDPAVRRRALVSENKSLCHPASVDSIPTSAGPGGSRVDGQRRRPEGVAGRRERGARARDRAARRDAGGRVPRAARAWPRRRARRTRSSGRCRHACATTGRSSSDIEAVAATIRDGSLLAAVESEVGELE